MCKERKHDFVTNSTGTLKCSRFCQVLGGSQSAEETAIFVWWIGISQEQIYECIDVLTILVGVTISPGHGKQGLVLFVSRYSHCEKYARETVVG